MHGPTPRSYAQRTPKKMKAAALRGALSDRAAHGRILVASALVDSDVPSTKAAIAALNEITEHQKVLVVARRGDEITWKSLRNVVDVHLLDPGQLNTYDVLVNDVGLEAIRECVTKPLEGMKVACYYGCQIVRPFATFDNQQNPTTMERIMATIGEKSIWFQTTGRCRRTGPRTGSVRSTTRRTTGLNGSGLTQERMTRTRRMNE